MTWTASASGTQTATIGTEHTLITDVTNGTYYYQVDVNNMVLGDVLELRIYTICLSGGASSLTWQHTIGPGLPPETNIASPAQPSDQSYKATLKQTAGTGRAFPWKVLRQ